MYRIVLLIIFINVTNNYCYFYLHSFNTFTGTRHTFTPQGTFDLILFIFNCVIFYVIA